METIYVTAEHIAKGNRDAATDKGDNCAIALAVKDHFKVTTAHVEPSIIEVHKGPDDCDVYYLNKKAEAWMERFDAGEAVEPFAFKIGRPL